MEDLLVCGVVEGKQVGQVCHVSFGVSLVYEHEFASLETLFACIDSDSPKFEMRAQC